MELAVRNADVPALGRAAGDLGEGGHGRRLRGWGNQIGLMHDARS